MKKYLLITVLLFAATAGFAKKVKFSVNMIYETIDTTGVHVSGDFQAAAGYPGGDWMPNTTTMLPETSDPNIYSVIVDVPAFAKYEFKYLNGDQTYNVEFVPYESRVLYNFSDNRWIYVDSLSNDTMELAPVVFGANAPPGKYLLRFRVDMQNEVLASAGAHVASDLQGWDPAATQLYSFDGNMYEYIAYVDTGMNSTVYEFKYVNGNTSAGYETIPAACEVNNNRGVSVPKDTLLESICFSACVNCLSIGIHEETTVSAFNLFPNPSDDFTLLQFNDGTSSHDVIVTDVSGREVRRYTGYSENQLRIEKENMDDGVYLVTVVSSNTTAATVKWIVR